MSFYSKDDYMRNPYLKTEKSDFTPFYIAITICTVLGLSIFILNVVLGCCSRYSEYWNDIHTGNRWIVSLWTATPHNQPALDYSELENIYVPPVQQVVYHHPPTPQPQFEYLELEKKESDI